MTTVLMEPGKFSSAVTPGPRTFVVVMNHHIERDSESLRLALESDAPYIGVLGPRSRLERLLASLKEEGFTPGAGMLSRVRSPIGLLRGLDLQKAPGIAESLDWAQALVSLHRDHLDAGVMEQTIGCVLKVREDHGVVESHREALAPVLGGATRLSAGGHSLETDFGFGSVTRPQS